MAKGSKEKKKKWGFPPGSVHKQSAFNEGDLGLIPGSGRSPEEGTGNSLQQSCLENLMDRGAWRAIVHGVARVGQDLGKKLPSPPPSLLPPTLLPLPPLPSFLHPPSPLSSLSPSPPLLLP